MTTSIQRTWLLTSLLTLLSGMSSAELGTGLLFCDGMVLQRDRPVRIWGDAEPGGGALRLGRQSGGVQPLQPGGAARGSLSHRLVVA